MTDRLYANKYKTPDDLESGYMNLQTAHNQKVQTLESQLAEYKVPDDYALPEGMEIPEADLALNKSIAKKAGLSQKQFNELLGGIGEVAKTNQQKAQEAQQAQAAETAAKRAKFDATEFDTLEKFLPELFPDEISRVIKQKLVEPQVFEKVKALRDKLTANSLPGVSAPPAAPTKVDFDEKKLLDARRLAERNPSNEAFRDAYLAELRNKNDYQKQKDLTNQ